jgi:ABC-2 type transport system ATP-binding protein
VERVCDRVAIIRAGQLVALSDVSELLARRRRSVEMRVEGSAPQLESVAGVSNVQHRDGRVTLQIEGDMAAFLAAICGARVTDLTIEPARLEEAFLEFYADQEQMADEQLDAGEREEQKL